MGLKGDCSSSSWPSVDWEGYLSKDGTPSESSERGKIWGSLLLQRRPSAKPPGADSKSEGPAQDLGFRGAAGDDSRVAHYGDQFVFPPLLEQAERTFRSPKRLSFQDIRKSQQTKKHDLLATSAGDMGWAFNMDEVGLGTGPWTLGLTSVRTTVFCFTLLL